jgi:hypothetical protein
MSCLSAGTDISDEKAGALSQFINSMPGILPCRQCGKHLHENLQIIPFNRADPFRWSVDIHNLVNAQLNKPEIDYEKALSYWSAKCSGTQINYQWIGLCIVFLVVLLLMKKIFT